MNTETAGLKDKPFMSGADYGRSLQGLGINLLVRDIGRSVAFCRDVLGARILHSNADFAAIRHDGLTGGAVEWMLHADGTYRGHPLPDLLGDHAIRGIGIEIRLYGCDPDRAEAQALALGHHVLAGSRDKPHGLREAYILDPDGYCWVPSVKLPA